MEKVGRLLTPRERKELGAVDLPHGVRVFCHHPLCAGTRAALVGFSTRAALAKHRKARSLHLYPAERVRLKKEGKL